MKNVMKRNVPATLLAVILIFSLCLSFTAFAEGETQETGTETAAETAAENITEPVAEVTAEEVIIDISAAELPTEPLEPIETVESASEGVLLSEDATEADVTEGDSAEEKEPAEATTEEETKEKEEKTEEEDDPVKKLAEVRNKLTKLEENESFDIKEAYDQYAKLETEEEQAAFIAAIPEADEESDDNANLFREYLTLKTEEQALLVKVEALKEKNPEAAKISEVEAELKFAEEEIAAAEAEIAALEETIGTEIANIEETHEVEIDEEPVAEAEASNIEDEIFSEEQETTIEEPTDETRATDSETPAEEIKEETKEIFEDEVTEVKVAIENSVVEEKTESDSALEENSADSSVQSEDLTVENAEINVVANENEIEDVIEKNVELWYEYEGKPEYGREVTINSKITGYGDNVSLQWYFSTDGENYEPVEGETGNTLVFILDEINCWYYWDLVVKEQ